MPAYHGSAKKIGNSNIVWTKAPCDSKNKIKKRENSHLDVSCQHVERKKRRLLRKRSAVLKLDGYNYKDLGNCTKTGRGTKNESVQRTPQTYIRKMLQ